MQSGRRTDRVSMTLLLEASGNDANGQAFKSPAKTLIINRHGGVVILERELKPDQQIHIQRISPAAKGAPPMSGSSANSVSKGMAIFMALKF